MEGHPPPLELLPRDAANTRITVTPQTHHLQSGKDSFEEESQQLEVIIKLNKTDK